MMGIILAPLPMKIGGQALRQVSLLETQGGMVGHQMMARVLRTVPAISHCQPSTILGTTLMVRLQVLERPVRTTLQERIISLVPSVITLMRPDCRHCWRRIVSMSTCRPGEGMGRVITPAIPAMVPKRPVPGGNAWPITATEKMIPAQ